MRPTRRAALDFTKKVCNVAAILAILYLARSNWYSLQALLAAAPLWKISLPVAVLVVNALIGPVTTFAVLRSFGHGFSYSTLAGLYMENLPLRYLPGGIWQTVGRFTQLNTLGVGARDLSALLVMENFFPLAIASGIGCLLFSLFVASERISPLFLEFGSLAALGALVAMMTLWFGRIGRVAARRHRNCLLGVPVSQILFWLFQCTAFSYYAMLFGFSGSGCEDLISTAGAYLLAWSVGFVAIFAPQGIGVQEYVLSYLQGQQQGPEVAIVIAAGFRLVQIMADSVSWLILRPVVKRRGGGTPTSAP